MKHPQESELEFRFDGEENAYPVARGIIIHQYGGTLEECVKQARKRFRLDYHWKLIRSEDSGI